MINSAEQVIADKLTELYPGKTIYTDDNVPQKFSKPSFFVSLIDQDYSKRLNTKYISLLSFDVAYFSDKGVTDIKSECQMVQLNLFREFDLVGAYRILSKQATTVDNVLHFTFDIKISEIKVEENTLMQQMDATTNI